MTGSSAGAGAQTTGAAWQVVVRRLTSNRWANAMAIVVGALGLSSLALEQTAAVLGGTTLAVVALLVLYSPAIALVLLFFLEPFHVVIYDAVTVRLGLGVGPASFWKDGVIVALLIRGAVGRSRAGPWRGTIGGWGDALLVAYVLALALAAALSPDLRNAGYALALVAEGPLLFLAIVWLRPSRRTVWACLAALILAASLMALTAIIEQLGPQAAFDPWFGGKAPPAASSFLLAEGGYRSGSFLASPLTLAFYLTAALPVGAAVAVAVRGSARVVATGAAAIMVVGLIVTFTRSGYLGGGIALLLALGLAVRNRRVRAGLLGSLVVAACAAAALSVTTGDDHLAHGTGGDQAHASRIPLDISLIADHPLGVGLGQTNTVAQRFDDPAAVFVSESDLLARALEGGVAMLALYLTVIGVTCLRLRTARRDALLRGDQPAAALAAGAIGAQLGVVVAGLFLGVELLAIEIVIWGASALALVLAGDSPVPASTAPEAVQGHRQVAD